MGTLTSAPRTLRGAIVAVDPLSPISRIVIFQYNPDEFSRTVEPPGEADQGGSSGNKRFGAPKETLTLTVELDATDQLDDADPMAATVGIMPQLATLEMLLHPSSARVIANTALLLAGTIMLTPIERPLTVLAWGPGRVLPVKITKLAVTEQAFGPTLFPIRASVELSADVISYDDVSPTKVAYGLSVAHLVAKEVMANAATLSNAGRAAAGLVGG